MVVDKREISNEEWRKGLQMEDRLHHELTEFVNTETTFEELYYHINEIIFDNDEMKPEDTTIIQRKQ